MRKIVGPAHPLLGLRGNRDRQLGLWGLQQPAESLIGEDLFGQRLPGGGLDDLSGMFFRQG